MAWADLNANIRQAKKKWNPWWFRDQVKNKGPWDFKQQGALYQDFGNFHYGATGLALGLSEGVLLREAGNASLAADPSRRKMGLGDPGSRWKKLWSDGTPPFGDDPYDQEQIKKGAQYCKCILEQ